jgi:hypothetical protein
MGRVSDQGPAGPAGLASIADAGRAVCLALLCACACTCACAQASPAEQLRARFEAARAQPAANVFDRPIVLQSTEGSSSLQGEVQALIDQPFEEARAAFTRPGPWCDILILHLNVKYCRVTGDTLDVGIGRKFDQALADVYWVHFTFRAVASRDDYLDVRLQAAEGPLGTRDFRILVEAAPYAVGKTLVHMTYAYSYGLVAHWALDAYLATLGSGKVGFSVVGQGADGQPIRVGGERGVLERNTMRYYLAIEAYLGASSLAAAQRLPRQLQDWFSATERYPQLHEIERDAYLAMKLREVRRQETEAAPAHAN